MNGTEFNVSKFKKRIINYLQGKPNSTMESVDHLSTIVPGMGRPYGLCPRHQI